MGAPRTIMIALLAITVGACATTIPLPATPSRSDPSIGPSPSGEVAGPITASECLRRLQSQPATTLATNGRAFTCRGSHLQLSGSTFYPALLGGARAWHQRSFPTYIRQIVGLARSAGLNLLRPTDFWDSHDSDQSATDPVVWANVDELLSAAADSGMLVELDLSAYRWLVQSHGHDPFDATAWTSFLTWVGKRYSGRAEIAFYSILGEPPVPASAAQSGRLVAFYRQVTDTLAAADPTHLIAAGGFNHMAETGQSRDWWQAIWALPHDDVGAFKTYSAIDLGLIPSIAAEAGRIRKPLVEEEFGMPQASGDDTWSGAAFNGLRTGRASFYDRVYQAGGAADIAAFVFWNLGCQIGPRSFEVSPRTPAAWLAIVDHAPEPAGPTAIGCPPS